MYVIPSTCHNLWYHCMLMNLLDKPKHLCGWLLLIISSPLTKESELYFVLKHRLDKTLRALVFRWLSACFQTNLSLSITLLSSLPMWTLLVQPALESTWSKSCGRLIILSSGLLLIDQSGEHHEKHAFLQAPLRLRLCIVPIPLAHGVYIAMSFMSGRVRFCLTNCIFAHMAAPYECLKSQFIEYVD